MSLLSQFFPSGSGASTSKITTNMLLVGGGGGGLPGSSGSPPACFPSCFSSPYYCSYRSGAGGGGGGAGEVFLFKNYSVTSGKQLTITVGSGGGDSSNGGTSIICVVDESNFIASGGKGTTTQCTTICEQYYSAVTSNNYGGGNGGTGCTYYCCPLGSFTTPIVCASSTSNFCGQGSRSSLPSSCPSSCISNNPYQSICLYDYSDAGIVIKGSSSKGGISPYQPVVLISNPSPYTFTRKSGQGGGGGGGSTGAGGAGCCGCLMSPCLAPGCCVKGGDGGGGGNGFTTDILGTSTCFALGGGGGGGSFTGTVGPSPYIPANCLYGRGGPSVNGGCGGRGSYSNPCCAPCTCGLGCPGCAATANTGGGGGGGGFGYCTAGTGGSGGSGVVIIQYPTIYPAAPAPARPGSTDCSPSTPGCYTYKFNGPGSITLP